MKDLIITVKKSDVYEEVAKTTAYIGAKNKLEDGKSAFDQVFVTDADLAMIERFYNESVDSLMNLLKQFVDEIVEDNGNIYWKLTLSSRFDIKMEPSIIRSVSSFLVNSIIGKWCEITAPDKVKEYAGNAAALLLDIKDKVFHKSAPSREKPQ